MVEFIVRDEDGVDVFRGTRSDFKKEYKTDVNLFQYIGTDVKLWRKYSVYRVDGKRRCKDEKTETPLEAAIRMLKIYGNTYYRGEKEEIIKQFSEAGMNVLLVPSHYGNGYILTRKDY